MNIFEIDMKLSSLLNEIEENGGEITEEQSRELEITEQNLKDKLSAYKAIVFEAKGDIEKVKCESKRLSERKELLTNRIDRMKDIMLDAVIKYGEEGKNNKFVELPDARLYTKASQSINIHGDRIDIFIYCLKRFIKEGFVEYTKESLLNYINECAKEYFNYEESECFTLADLDVIKINVNKTYNIMELIASNTAIDIGNQLDSIETYEMTLNTPKEDFKVAINSGEDITIAQIDSNTSLIIK